MTDKPRPKPIIRLYDWHERLTTYLMDCREEGIKLDWEFHNCGTFICGAIEAMTGIDLYEPFRDKFDDPKGAYLAIKRAGFDSIEDIILSHFEEVPLTFVQRGDLVLGRAHAATDMTDYSSLGMPNAMGIADGVIYWGISEEGVGSAPIDTAVQAFAVGR